MRNRGFSLVELLVVIGIIAILIGILIPVMGKVKSSGYRAACMSNLREIGNCFNMYLNENKQRVPRVNPLKSVNLLGYNAPTIYEVLERYTKGANDVFCCPLDRIVNTYEGAPQAFESYFMQEGGSYEYNVFFNAFAFDPQTGINKVWRDALDDASGPNKTRKADKIIIFRDFDPFHDKAGRSKSRNYLYADFSVDQERRDSMFMRPPRPPT